MPHQTMDKHQNTQQQIEQLLISWGAISAKVVDNSHLHVGHEGAKSGGGHFAVTVIAAQFTGLNRLQCHRLVYQQLNSLFKTGAIHALEVEAMSEEKK